MRKTFLVLSLMVLLFAQACGFEVVDTGYRGVQTRFGEVVSDSLGEGLHFYNPFSSDITELEVREQKWESKTLAYTSDTQNVEVTFTINYYPDAAKMHIFFKDQGKDWENKLIPQMVEDTLKSVVGGYKAEDLVVKRSEAVSKIKEKLRENFKSLDIIIKNFAVNNLNFNDAFENAIEAKVVAEQKAKESINKTVQIREEAKQKVLSAEAEAKSMSIRARALSQNKSLVEYEFVQRWNGVLPQYNMGNAVPFINIK